MRLLEDIYSLQKKYQLQIKLNQDITNPLIKEEGNEEVKNIPTNKMTQGLKNSLSKNQNLSVYKCNLKWII